LKQQEGEIKKNVDRALRGTLAETEQRFQDELEKKIQDLKDEYADKLKDEVERAKADSEAMIKDEMKELNQKHKKEIDNIMKDAENDPDVIDREDRLRDAEEVVREKEAALLRAKKILDRIIAS